MADNEQDNSHMARRQSGTRFSLLPSIARICLHVRHVREEDSLCVHMNPIFIMVF